MDTNTSGSTITGWRAFTKKDWLAFDRADYIGAKILVGIIVVGSVLFGLIAPIVNAVTNAPLPVTYTSEVPDGIPLPRGATLDGLTTVHVLLSDATSFERLAQALPAFISAGLTIAIALLFFPLLRSIQGGEPFTRGNVRRINAIALIIGFGWGLVPFVQGFADSAIYTTGRLPRPSTMVFVMTFTPLPIVIMVVVALIGEAFRRGVALREDTEGLV